MRWSWKRGTIAGFCGAALALAATSTWPRSYTSRSWIGFRVVATGTDAAITVRAAIARYHDTALGPEQMLAFAQARGVCKNAADKVACLERNISFAKTKPQWNRSEAVCCWVLSVKGDSALLAQALNRDILNALLQVDMAGIFQQFPCPPVADCEGDGLELLEGPPLPAVERRINWPFACLGFIVAVLVSRVA